ncbi:MAG: patatin-like phospholipase family protein [Saprospiraceae bacterium]|nr:patatin-like phospholipase family protein [Saprospiraceae bacterium]
MDLKEFFSLDGGGVRGILTLGILKHIEDKIQEGHSDKNNPLKLCDYYDLIGGTSTGAIIACGLAIGKTVDQIIDLYQSLGKEIFGKGRKCKILKRSWTTTRAILK